MRGYKRGKMRFKFVFMNLLFCIGLFLIIMNTVSPALPDGSNVTRSFSSATVQEGDLFTVNLDVTLNGGDFVHNYSLIDETFSSVFTMNNSGTGDISDSGHIKWANIMEDAPIVALPGSIRNSYTLRAPTGQQGTFSFDGLYLIDGMTDNVTIEGQTDVTVSASCALIGAYWSVFSTTEDTQVGLIVQGDPLTCNGVTLNFYIWEQDPLVDDLTNTSVTAVFDSLGVARGFWNAEWECDGLDIFGFCTLGNPEYYFTATPVSNSNNIIQSNLANLLRVTAGNPECGNNFTQIGEDCDDGNSDNTDLCLDTCRFTFCGDNIVQTPNGRDLFDEVCDGDFITCTTTPEGYNGTQACYPEGHALECTDYAPCSTTEYCGDGDINGNEICAPDEFTNINGSFCFADVGVCGCAIPDEDGDGVNKIGCFGGTDCDDLNASIWTTSLAGYVDIDGDNYTIGSGVLNLCTNGVNLPSGYAPSNPADCNDADAGVWANQTGYLDNDTDTYTIGAGIIFCTDGVILPNDYVDTPSATVDCNDTNINIWESMTGFADADNDGYTVPPGVDLCTNGTLSSGYKVQSPEEDCDDTNDLINPLAIEICDNDDNNCDGQTDEGLTNATTCGVGECAGNMGQVTCTAGSWGGDTCDSTGGWVPEVCEGSLDDDCDGDIDNGCPCSTGQTQSCGSDVGECVSGLQTCTLGVWGSCVGNTGPVAETCDGLDNNCVGGIDEGLTQATTCGVGLCSGNGGIETCTVGVWGGDTCNPLAGSQPDTTCDNVDDDCDGTPDDDYPITATSCGVGICSGNVGQLECQSGSPVDTCDRYAGAVAESCAIGNGVDGIDDNCDGVDPDCESFCDEDVDGYSGNILCILWKGGGFLGDCEPTIATINPGAIEGPFGDPTCIDLYDNDCDGDIDAADSLCAQIITCTDNDDDGYGSPADATCTYSTLDCDDTNINIWESMTGFNDTDGDTYTNGSAVLCTDGSLPSGFRLNPFPGDCNDFDDLINPNATEICRNNVDENCDGNICVADNDGDTVDNVLDCNDNDDTIGECIGCAQCDEDESLDNNAGTCVSDGSLRTINCPNQGVCGNLSTINSNCGPGEFGTFPTTASASCVMIDNNKWGYKGVEACFELMSCVLDASCSDDNDGDGIPDNQDYCNNTVTNPDTVYGYPKPIMTEFVGQDYTKNITNWDAGNLTDFVMGIDGVAKVDFTGERIKLYRETSPKVCEALDIDQYVNISYGRVDIDSANIEELNKSAVITMHNIILTSPQIIIDGAVCGDCDINSYIDNVLSFNVTHFSSYGVRGRSRITGDVVYEVRETPAPPGDTSPSSPPSSSSSSSSASTIIPKTFDLDPTSMAIDIKQGEISTESFTITNTGNTNRDFVITSNSDMIDVEESLSLASGDSATVEFFVTVLPDKEPGIYIGKVSVTSGSDVKELLVSINIGSGDSLFDVVLDLPESFLRVLPGNKISFSVLLTKLTEANALDVLLSYIIKNEDGEEIVSKNEVIDVTDTSTILEGELELPRNLPAGQYSLQTQIEYDGKIANSAQWFDVEGTEKRSQLWKLALIGFILVVIFLVIILYIKKKQTEDELSII